MNFAVSCYDLTLKWLGHSIYGEMSVSITSDSEEKITRLTQQPYPLHLNCYSRLALIGP